MIRLVAILLISVAIVLTGCSQVAQNAVEQTTGVKVDQKGDNVTIQGKDGESVTVSSKLPDQLKDFPVPDGFKLGDQAGSVSSKDSSMASAQWKGSGTIEAATAFYKKTMLDKGWKETQTMTIGDAAQFIYSKDDQNAMVSISKADNAVAINVVFTRSAK